MAGYNETTGAVRGLPFRELSRDEPRYTGAAVGAVLGLALGAGLLAFVGVGLVALAVGWTVKVALFVAGVAVLATGLYWLLDAKSLMFATETVTGLDLDGDGVQGPPRAETVRVEVHEPDRGRWAFLDLPGTPEQLAQLGRGLLGGVAFTETDWTGSGRPYSKGDFVKLRAQLVERGVLRWRDERVHTLGCELTYAGRSMFGALVKEPSDVRTHPYVRDGGPVATLGDGREGGGL